MNQADTHRNDENFGVCIIVLHPKSERILLGKRKNGYRAGWYGIPGGRVDFNEPLVQASKRELKEETGLIADDLQFIGTVRDQQQEFSFIHFGYLARSYQGNPVTVEPEKCEGWEWKAFENLPNKILPGHKAVIEMFLSSGNSKLTDRTLA